jgi:hypothetical protein
MAKQSFTVGQVLTAAQLTSLQQTAMLGGAAQAKTSSYVLVAADAGTAISMTSTSATTVTVNTGLFAAGDTVFIQNLGSGNLTITAGTATVATAGSLILPQNDAGILYFTATGTATFYDFIQAGAVSPLTTKGDLYGFSTLDARIPIGTNNQVLTADSAQALGLKWATPTSGSLTLLSTTTLSGSTTTISSISGSYTNLVISIENADITGTTGYFRIAPNGTINVSNGMYSSATNTLTGANNSYILPTGLIAIQTGTTKNSSVTTIYNYASTAFNKSVFAMGNTDPVTAGQNAGFYFGAFVSTTAISSIVISTPAGTMTGSVKIYGAN